MSLPLFSPPLDIRRVALPLRSASIRLTVPGRVLGAYCIYQGGLAVYVGRSDRCVRERLLAHAASDLGTHFTWQRASHAKGAFFLESLWFHQLIETGHALNRVHPARPLAEIGATCPICDDTTEQALRAVLSQLKERI